MGKQFKAITAVVVFLLIALFPFIYNNALKGHSKKPLAHLEKAKSGDGKCIVGSFEADMSDPNDVADIRAKHGDLLSHAGVIPGKKASVRDQYVREMKREEKGLGGCIECHQNRTKFCDQCHDYVGVYSVNEYTGCFACHYYPKNESEFKAWQDAKNK